MSIHEKLKKREQLLQKLRQEYREKIRTAESSIAFSLYRMLAKNQVSEELCDILAKEYMQYIASMAPKTQRLTLEYVELMAEETKSPCLKKIAKVLKASLKASTSQDQAKGEQQASQAEQKQV